jgi:hypothetical protein
VPPSAAAEKMQDLTLPNLEVPKAYRELASKLEQLALGRELASKLEQLALGLDPQKLSAELHQRQAEQINETYKRQTEQVAEVVRRMDEVKRLSDLHPLENTLAKSGSR